VSNYTLGQRVRFAERIKRRYVDTYNQPYPKGPNRVWSGEAYPGKRLDGGEGIIIGKRTLSDGTYHYGNGEEPGEYDAHRHFTAYLIVTSLRSAPVHVLPEHITALEPEPEPDVCPFDCDSCHDEDCPCDRLGCAGSEAPGAR